MPLDGPNVFVADAAASFAWAHYFSEKCCGFRLMGPPYLLLLLLLTLPGPIVFLRGVSHILEWAYCICRICC